MYMFDEAVSCITDSSGLVADSIWSKSNRLAALGLKCLLTFLFSLAFRFSGSALPAS